MDNETSPVVDRNKDAIKDENNNKDETDDDTSESTDDNKALIPADLKIKSLAKMHFKARSVLEGITPKEQKEIAADMFGQMRQLKAANDVMGYHGFSGLLQRHDSSMNITGNEPELQRHDSDMNNTVKVHSDNDSDSYRSDTQTNIININVSSEHSLDRYDGRRQSHLVLSETKPLREKLEIISMSINKIRQDLESSDRNTDNVFSNISNKQLTETIMFFQNQLTAIQDQIEDAENDIESHIDVKLLKYIEEIELNKQKIKTMKKERKQKERQLQISKEKEQNKIIEMQRSQIAALIQAQTAPLTPLSHSQTMSQLTFKKRTQKPKRRHSIASLPVTDSEIDMNEMNDINMATNDNLRFNMTDINETQMGHCVYDMGDMSSQIPMQYSNASPMTFNNEGHSQYPYHNGIRGQSQRQQPLLSDSAMKIVGGVAIFLSGVWIVSKYIDSKGGPSSANVYRGPRFKY